ncbi:hypothetical protein ETD86_25120 [Nonomuraea turkmeniaca]|uniref:Uncharacterized protein n=1 Tax=Nonomuraea turkmeniaca TaxID=103838 RepID=A0A5S4FDT3_9ACTN|nr:hypothetical protein [Nonomuraea turkmeniaca]TMR16493.1 hypothetical protein ETD86_25120 [Nonomuraea turkmeniaca]
MAALKDSDQFVIPLVKLAITALEDHVDHMVTAELPKQTLHTLAASTLLALRVHTGADDDNACRL